MKYIVGTNQNIALYRAMFSSKCLALPCNNKIQKAVHGMEHHNTKPVALGIYGHNDLFVEVLWNSSSLYSTLLALDIRYGDKIRITSSRKTPPGIKSINVCAINAGIDGSVKNIKFQKLSLFNLALIKLLITLTDIIGIFTFDDNKLELKRPYFSGKLSKYALLLTGYLDNLRQMLILTRRAELY